MVDIKIEITIKSDDPQSDLDAICNQNRYQEEIEGPEGVLIPNPESKKVFAKRKLAEVAENWVITWNANEAQRLAREQSLDKTENETIIE